MRVNLIVGTFFVLSLSASAQVEAGQLSSNRQNNSSSDALASETLSEADRLIRTYQFEDAISWLQREIAAAKRKKSSTTLLEVELDRARTGATMLEATEKVVFIDSISIAKDDFLSAFRLSASVGKLGRIDEMLPETNLSGFSRKGQTLFLNDFGDKAYFSLPDSSGCLKMHASYRLGGAWTTPERLQGFWGEDGEDGDMDYPFLLADGVTLYYAAQGNDGLGGYDIFVTRYNSDTKQFVRPENIGMPFNSPYNDYLYVVDEETGIGWFVSDRYQPADKVCVYSFIPNESREIYDSSETDEDQLRQAARLSPFSQSRGTDRQVEEAHARLQALGALSPESQSTSLRFLINDNTVYTALSQFRSPSARLIASQWVKTWRTLHEQENKLEEMRRKYATGQFSPDCPQKIVALEKEVEELRMSANTLEKNMRVAELTNK